MQFPIDTSRLLFVVAIPAAPVIDFKSKEKEPRKVKVDGEMVTLLAVHLLVMDGNDSALIKFNMTRDPGVVQGQIVKVTGLTHHIAKNGEMRWWGAEAVEPIGPPMPGGPPTPVLAADSSPSPAGQGSSAARRGRNPMDTSGAAGGEA